MLDSGNDLVARRILLDSPPFRLAWKIITVDETHRMVLHDHDLSKPLGLDLDSQLAGMRAKGQSSFSRAAEFASRSGSVFVEADGSIVEVEIDALTASQFGGVARAVHEDVARRLRERHAYDQWDEKLLRRVESIRNQLGARVQQLANPFGDSKPPSRETGIVGMSLPFAEPLASIQSHEVIEGQAGDVAARMAAILFEREGLPGVVRRFTFVTFNGERVGEQNMDAVLRRPVALAK